MATYQVLYWQDIPSQVRANDSADEVTLPLDPRFMERIDRLAIERGLQGAHEYLAEWHWSDEEERDGTAEDVAHAVKRELEAGAGLGSSA